MNEKLNEYLQKLNLKIFEKLNYEVRCDEKITLVDLNGYLFYLSKSNLRTLIRRNGTPAIFFNLNPYAKENINNYIKINKINIELITKDFSNVDAKSKLMFNCDLHGEFSKCWNEIKNGQHCPLCGRDKCANSKKNKYEDIKLGFENKGYILVSEEYIDNQTPLQYICKKHIDKGIQQVSWASLISNKGCCKYCSKENRRYGLNGVPRITKSPEQFEKEIHEIYKDKFVFIDKYVDSKTKIKMFCNDCKTEFNGHPAHLLEGHLGCGCREKSFGELIIKEFLENNKIPFDRQYRIKGCRNKKPLPFDFVIFNNKEQLEIKYLIEFQGKQHYENTGWSSNKETSKEHFDKQILNDNIKRNYCKVNNIELIEIPYWEIRNISKILSELLDINNKN